MSHSPHAWRIPQLHGRRILPSKAISLTWRNLVQGREQSKMATNLSQGTFTAMDNLVTAWSTQRKPHNVTGSACKLHTDGPWRRLEPWSQGEVTWLTTPPPWHNSAALASQKKIICLHTVAMPILLCTRQ